jgi:lipopolysaccharide export system permease protein
VIVPIGFFLAIVLALGRLYHESEMAALQACGVGPAGLFRPITALGLLIVVLLAWLAFFAIPQASARAQAIRTEAMRDAQFGALEPGRFRPLAGGTVVFYAERVDANGILHNVNVFVDRPPTEKSHDKAAEPADTASGATATNAPEPSAPASGSDASTIDKTAKADAASNLEVWVASRAEQRGVGQPEQTFVLYDGYRYEGTPGSGEFRIIRFSEGGIPIPLGSVTDAALKAAMKPTAELLASSKRDDIAELHWRIATPVSAIVLMLIAVPLSRLRPRQGRFGKIGIAILVYFLYSRLMVSGKTWIETSAAPSWSGLWWVHGVALIFAVWLLLRDSPPGRAKMVSVSPGSGVAA